MRVILQSYIVILDLQCRKSLFKVADTTFSYQGDDIEYTDFTTLSFSHQVS